MSTDSEGLHEDNLCPYCKKGTVIFTYTEGGIRTPILKCPHCKRSKRIY